MKYIAYYLPQFHAIPENDEWWGKGFTEWTNVKKAKPLFYGHYQPRVPAYLGYYNLLNVEVQLKQVALAKEYGIFGFAYWHYWFGDGNQLLEKPIKNVLNNPLIDFPFCFSWANQTWTGIWHGAVDRILIEQKYLGIEDDKRHFFYCFDYFTDKRYIRIDNKPVFLIYRPDDHPYLDDFIQLWNDLAVSSGLDGIYFIGIKFNNSLNIGLNAIARQDFWLENTKGNLKRTNNDFVKKYINFKRAINKKIYPCDVQAYEDMVKNTYNFELKDYEFPTILTGWDNTPRSGILGKVLKGFSTKNFGNHIKKVISKLSSREESKKLVFIKSWNEWAEGNYLEPDKKNGFDFLKVIKDSQSY